MTNPHSKTESSGDTDQPGTELLERLVAISCSMNLQTSHNALLSCISDYLQEWFNAENSLVVLVDDHHRLGRMPVADSEPPRAYLSLIERVLEQKRTLLIEDARVDPELHEESHSRLETRSILCVPLLTEGRVIGIIQFDRRDEPGSFTPEQQHTLDLFARQAAVALQTLPQRAQLQNSLERQRELEAQALTAERGIELSGMAATMAHDLNNLLMATMGIGELMLDRDDLPEGLRKDAKTLCSIAVTSAGIVRRLQHFDSNSNSAAEIEPIDISAELATAIEICRARFAKHGNPQPEFVVDYGKVPTVMVRADEVCNILLNVLINAIEAMRDGGTLTARTREEKGWGVVEIEDTGPGINDAVANSVFKPFFSTKEHGHGLGLAICREMTHKLGGEISLHPAKQRGTICRIRLPTSRKHTDPEPSVRPGSTSNRLEVLVVDDNPRVLAVVSKMVKRLGHDVAPALGSGAGFRLLKDGNFDMVITDLYMPGMNGTELASEVRQYQPRARIVLLAGTEEEADPSIFDCTLVKPVSLEALRMLIGTVDGRTASS